MKKENRESERYEEMGRVDCKELCSISGVLDDVSLSGCKIHFPVAVAIDMEEEYPLSIKWISKDGPLTLELIGKPQWCKYEDTKTFIGFRILRSPDTPELQKWVRQLSEKSDSLDEVKDLLIDSSVRFI